MWATIRNIIILYIILNQANYCFSQYISINTVDSILASLNISQCKLNPTLQCFKPPFKKRVTTITFNNELSKKTSYTKKGRECFFTIVPINDKNKRYTFFYPIVTKDITIYLPAEKYNFSIRKKKFKEFLLNADIKDEIYFRHNNSNILFFVNYILANSVNPKEWSAGDTCTCEGSCKRLISNIRVSKISESGIDKLNHLIYITIGIGYYDDDKHRTPLHDFREEIEVEVYQPTDIYSFNLYKLLDMEYLSIKKRKK